jgi:hypothetical protein
LLLIDVKNDLVLERCVGNGAFREVHAHDGSKRLEPEWMRQATQEFVATIAVDNAWEAVAD